ncbi:MAG: (2Fe-2S)-binding protein [Clostridia bacterium]
MSEIILDMNINGENISIQVPSNMRLIDILRVKLRLTGVKEGCGEGECGACTIIMNGKAVNSCLVLGIQADNATIITVEGLAKNGEMDILQQKFIEYGAIQCGFCTPGMLMSAKALLMHNPKPSKEEIREAIAGNLCRCTGYTPITKAIEAAVKV